MTTQTKLSNPIEVARESIIKQHFSLPLALAILTLGFLVGVFATKLSTAENNNEVNGQRAIEAEAARYSAMAKFYLTGDEVNTQRASEAEAARYNGLADFYGAEVEANSLAWPPRPTQFHIAENAAMPITENALAAYHQSEWGRTLSTVLPVAENGADANQDIGLMEFSTIVNEAGVQRHDREYGLAAVSTIPNESSPQPVIEADADQDIGLMEFLAVPNETSSHKAGTLLELHNK